MPLTFEQFRQANRTRCLKWHPGGIQSWSPSDWMTAIVGELGELASLIKMRNRERDGLPGNKFSPTDKQIADEAADVFTYLDLFCEAHGIDLGAAAAAKFNEVSERVGFPDRIATAVDRGLSEPECLGKIRSALEPRGRFEPTPGEWVADDHQGWAHPMTEVRTDATRDEGGHSIVRVRADFTCTVGKSEYEWANAAFVAACSPQNIRALLAYIDALAISAPTQAEPVGEVATMTNNPATLADVQTPGWKLHRCPDGEQCRASIGGGCASGWCGHFEVKPDGEGVPRFPAAPSQTGSCQASVDSGELVFRVESHIGLEKYVQVFPLVYIGGPYETGHMKGRRSVCELSSGRIIGVLSEEAAPTHADTLRLNWLEERAKGSPTGVSLLHTRHVEDGQVLEHGYRYMHRHFSTDFYSNIRQAIDAGMNNQQAR